MWVYFENKYNLIWYRKREIIPRKNFGVTKGAANKYINRKMRDIIQMQQLTEDKLDKIVNFKVIAFTPNYLNIVPNIIALFQT
jgi:hypothetical protein